MQTIAADHTGHKRFSIEEVTSEALGAAQVRIDGAHCGMGGTNSPVCPGHMGARIGQSRLIVHENPDQSNPEGIA